MLLFFSECESLVNDVMKEFGTVDICVNNAGISKDNLPNVFSRFWQADTSAQRTSPRLRNIGSSGIHPAPPPTPTRAQPSHGQTTSHRPSPLPPAAAPGRT